jgi:hypothetical protein
LDFGVIETRHAEAFLDRFVQHIARMKTALDQPIEEDQTAPEEHLPPVAPDPITMSAGTAAISGALAGAAGGPVCVAIGAAVGAIAGGVSALEPRVKASDSDPGRES